MNHSIMKMERIKMVIVFIWWVFAGFILGLTAYHYLIVVPPKKGIDSELGKSSIVKQEFERIRKEHQVEDSIFRSKHPEYGYPKYDSEDEDHPIIQNRYREKHQVDTQNETR